MPPAAEAIAAVPWWLMAAEGAASPSSAPAGEVFPLWLIAIVAPCLPIFAIVFWHIGQWWLSARDVPLPVDMAVPAVRWRTETGLAIFLGMFLMMVLLQLVYIQADSAGLLPWEPLDVPAMFSPVVFLELIVPALAGLLVVRLFGPGAAETVCVRLGSVGRGVATGVVALAAILPVCVAALAANGLIVQCLVQFFPEVQKVHPLLTTIQQSPQVWVLPLAALEAVVLAPLSEEFIYRGVLMTTLLRPAGTAGAMVISSAIFALVHLPSEPSAILPLFFLGMALAYAAWRTRSLVAPIVAHALFNAVMLLGSYLDGPR
jgi:hypothetical protein